MRVLILTILEREKEIRKVSHRSAMIRRYHRTIRPRATTAASDQRVLLALRLIRRGPILEASREGAVAMAASDQ